MFYLIKFISISLKYLCKTSCIQNISMSLAVKQDLETYNPAQMPFNNKPHIILTRLIDPFYFQEIICKTITILTSERLVFEELIAKLKDFQKEREKVGSQLGIKGVSVDVVNQGGHLTYTITRNFFKCKNLIQCLSNEKQKRIELVFPLLQSYLCTANLNHIFCSAHNLFLVFRPWSKQPYFQLNFTSIGFPFDLYRGKTISHIDIMEYANYLPIYFFQQKGNERFNYALKARSLAVNLLILVLGHDITPLRKEVKKNEHSLHDFKQTLEKVHSYFELFLQEKKNQMKIEEASSSLQVNLLKFFRTIILLPPDSKEFKEFNSWAKIVSYLKISFLAPYQKIFQFEKPRIGCKETYLQVWVRRMWHKENHYVRKKLIIMGIIDDASRDELIFYLLYRFNLINQLRFMSYRQAQCPQFLELVIKLYGEIFASDFLVNSAQTQSFQGNLQQRNIFLLEVIKTISEHLIEISEPVPKRVKKDQSIRQQFKELYVSKEAIHLKNVTTRCWHAEVSQ